MLPHPDGGNVTLSPFGSLSFIDLQRLLTPPASCFCAPQLFWAFGSIFEVLLALLVMPTLGWRWLLGLSTIPTGMFLIVNNVGRLAIEPKFPKLAATPTLTVSHSGFPRVLASTCCRDTPPRPWKLSDTSPNRTGSPCPKLRL